VSTLELREVVKRYEGGGEIVNAVGGVSLNVAPGEFVVLYGPSGSGKTTLLMMAATIKRPDSGAVVFDGRDVSSLTGRESARYRRETVGIVFQSFHLLPGTSALDNAALKLFALGMRLGDAREMARPWLERLGLGKRLEHKAVELSMGERQRVAIARALANEPRMLLADEPTGNLDSATSEVILALLSRIADDTKTIVLMATHNLEATGKADTIVRLQDGRVG